MSGSLRFKRAVVFVKKLEGRERGAGPPFECEFAMAGRSGFPSSSALRVDFFQATDDPWAATTTGCRHVAILIMHGRTVTDKTKK